METENEKLPKGSEDENVTERNRMVTKRRMEKKKCVRGLKQ